MAELLLQDCFELLRKEDEGWQWFYGSSWVHICWISKIWSPISQVTDSRVKSNPLGSNWVWITSQVANPQSICHQLICTLVRATLASNHSLFPTISSWCFSLTITNFCHFIVELSRLLEISKFVIVRFLLEILLPLVIQVLPLLANLLHDLQCCNLREISDDFGSCLKW